MASHLLSWLVMIRILLACSAALLLGTLGAFFLYVPALSIASVALTITGLTLMFGLGVQVGARVTRSDQLQSPDRIWLLDRGVLLPATAEVTEKAHIQRAD